MADQTPVHNAESLAPKMRQLYCGDNFEIMRDYLDKESVDLIYLDPPFNSNQSYNLLFEKKEGHKARSQKLAFEDTWEWSKEAHDFVEEITGTPGRLAEIFSTLKVMLGASDMLAYLAMMAPRLQIMKQLLRETGSIYLHCDPTASHYLKMLMDAIFEPQNFRNEIVWKRSHGHNSAKRFGCNHDIILFYSKGPNPVWNKIFHDYDPEYLDKHYRHVDKSGARYKHENPTGAGISKGVTGQPWRGINPTSKGRHWAKNPDELDRLDAAGLIHWPPKKGAWPYIKTYLKDMQGIPAQDTWADIDPINMMAKERRGYPTQKPQMLLERIISASSNSGDTVLDPFCGCGTAIEAAQKLDRQWIGIDVANLAIKVVRDRLKEKWPDIEQKYKLIYEPLDLETAETLAAENPFQFQEWAVRKLGGGEVRRGADQGIDGRLYFADDPTHKLKHIIVSVKAGKRITPAFIRDLRGTVEREKAAMGILIAATEPTKNMRQEAVSAGTYRSLLGNFPKIQIITAAQLLERNGYSIPPLIKIQTTKKNTASASLKQMDLPGISRRL